jgi:uncharacterized membrane protein
MIKLILTAVILVILDTFYIQFMKGAFTSQIQRVQGSKLELNLFGFLMTYIFLISGLYYFIIIENKNYTDAVILGLVVYGVYDFTNLTILKNWSLLLSLIDVLWGATLFGLTSFSVNLISTKVLGIGKK